MLDTIRQAFLVGLGTLDLTEEKLHGALSDLIKRGELTEKEAHQFKDEWRQRLTSRRDKLQQEAKDAVQRALAGLNVASRHDIEAMAKRVSALEEEVAQLRQAMAEAATTLEG
jgi:polyhydroxyalkanoate synthesis regulator phasin